MAKNNVNYGAPTTLDYAHAIAFARNMVNKLKCTDPDVVKLVCDKTNSGQNCIQWVEEPEGQTYPSVQNYYRQDCKVKSDCNMGFCSNEQNPTCTCQTDADCTQNMKCIQDPQNQQNLICGFADTDTFGHCIFANQNICESKGALPYTCDENRKCTMQDQDWLNTHSYTEWHTDENGENGTCIMGNYLLRQWCENPPSRDPNNSDTNIPPFFYDKSKGQCYMTNDYCQFYGQDYNMPDCSNAADCGKGNYCYSSTKSSTCVGPGASCYLPPGQEFTQDYIVGKTLFYMFKTGNFTCKERYTDEDYKELAEDITREFKKVPETAFALADSKYIVNPVKIYNNFAGPDIHLYMIFWKSGKSNVGFLADEVEKKYPKLVKTLPPGKFIIIYKNDLGDDKNIKRIFLTINSKGWFTEIIKKHIK